MDIVIVLAIALAVLTFVPGAASRVFWFAVLIVDAAIIVLRIINMMVR